ncbi:toxin VasX [Vibrio mexicanus]|uniref:toxin VasX n=1 Tax=Vibrio mexicanus TaxID=1004326 RepID=UPI00069961FA|nr:toxin VasX [Vibrio mexicanus]
MRARGHGNPQSYLQDYNWDETKRTINEKLDALLGKIKSRLQYMQQEASNHHYVVLANDIFPKHLDTLNIYMKSLPELISLTFVRMQMTASKLLLGSATVDVIKASASTYSAEAGVIDTVVNTIETIDTVDPFLNEVPGCVASVMPIYPVRYGYANFADEDGNLLPPQAPPTMAEMEGATGLQDTGGYVLRLLREGWIYIKEEGSKDQFHIFKYKQVETPTGVLEKFEKHLFTNGENAQDGLTLDTSSGATFYPFAFASANTEEISIAYSEHEWAPSIIDKMNEDEELRAKSMQRVDLTAASGDYSAEASEDNFTKLVEDYRTSEDKWLKVESDKPEKHGVDY